MRFKSTDWTRITSAPELEEGLQGPLARGRTRWTRRIYVGLTVPDPDGVGVDVSGIDASPNILVIGGQPVDPGTGMSLSRAYSQLGAMVCEMAEGVGEHDWRG